MRQNTHEKLPYQRIGDSVIDRLIAAHKETWGHEWPHGRRYVAELYIEAKERLGIPVKSKERRNAVATEALTLMRESHHFPDHPSPFGSA